MKFKKLDRRMTGYGVFKYAIDFPYEKDTVDFVKVRKWLQQQFGESVEWDIWDNYPDLANPHWAWDRGMFNKTYRCRIFVAGDAEYQWLLLKWN